MQLDFFYSSTAIATVKRLWFEDNEMNEKKINYAHNIVQQKIIHFLKSQTANTENRINRSIPKVHLFFSNIRILTSWSSPN